MSMNRREFIILSTALAASCAGCASARQDEDSASAARSATPFGTIDAGPAADYGADGVYDRFRQQGFFIIRQGERLFALSSQCTHRSCPLQPKPDHSFYCNCHGSTFDPAGKVTSGPAVRNLPVLELTTDSRAHVVVRV